ncbi:MAG TPA: 3-hydroxyacyl-ACP dehydratase FabZ family protein [Phycisphaerae bacterium]|nr:3-hydroxyacyl-ACP dehydratase FabZ family protein [Phycisphaerae bacterium]
MPPKPLVDFSRIDADRIEADSEGVRKVNPHRYEFQQLDGIYFVDRKEGLIAGFRDLRGDEFWVRGHIPGRPILPGVLMIEAAAQLVSYYVMSEDPGRGFLGFGGVDGVKFRGAVLPGQRLIILGKLLENRPRRCVGATQAFVDAHGPNPRDPRVLRDPRMVYEGLITGMWI